MHVSVVHARDRAVSVGSLEEVSPGPGEPEPTRKDTLSIEKRKGGASVDSENAAFRSAESFLSRHWPIGR